MLRDYEKFMTRRDNVSVSNPQPVELWSSIT